MPKLLLSRKRYIPYIVLILITGLFFHKTVISGQIPFPGDLLLNHYAPWRNSSYFGYNPGSIPSKDQYFDVIRELYPWKTLVVSELKQGRLPLWNPYNFSGTPLLANWQSQVFYPPALLYLILPQKIAWTVMVILQPLLGMVFMYLFATIIGISPAGAILSAVAFNFSAFAAVWLEFNTVWHTILWIPLLLYLTEKSLNGNKITKSRGILFILGLFSSLTGGHPQDFLYSLALVAVYTLVRILTLKIQKNIKQEFLIKFAFLVLTAFGLGAVQILPTIELFRQSARVPHDPVHIAGTMLIQIWQLPMLVVQDFFGNPSSGSYFVPDTYVGKTLSIGIAGFLLLLVVLLSKRKTWHEKFFLAAVGVILMLTVRTPLSELFYRFPLPVLSTGTPTRILFILAFSLSVISGFGFDRIRRNGLPKKYIFWVLLILVIFVCYAIFSQTFPFLPQDPRAAPVMKKAVLLFFAIAAAFLGTTFLAKKFRPAVYILIILTTAELLYGFLKFNPFVPEGYVFPENKVLSFLKENAGLSRFWGYGTAQIEADFATQYRLFDSNGTDPLNLASYNRLLLFSGNGRMDNPFTRQNRSDAYIKSGYGETDLPENRFRLKILDLLGVKYVLDREENPRNDKTFPTDRFTPVWQEEGFTVYENLKAAPRFFATADIRPYSTEAELSLAFAADSFDPRSTIMIEEKNLGFFNEVREGSASVELISYLPGEVILEADLETPQAVYISDATDGNWLSEIDGNKTPIITANYSFRAIPVPKGRHEIIMKYDPLSFKTGKFLTFLSLIVVSVFIVLPLKHLWTKK